MARQQKIDNDPAMMLCYEAARHHGVSEARASRCEFGSNGCVDCPFIRNNKNNTRQAGVQLNT